MTMNRNLFVCLFLVCLAAGVASVASAQNLVLNPGFDTNTANWAVSGPGTMAWSMVDANGIATSGSALLTNDSATPSNGMTVIQCIPMPARYAFRFSGKVMVPSGANQSLSNPVRVDVRFATDSNCTVFLLSATTLTGNVSQFDTWTTFGPLIRVAPLGTVAVSVRGLLTKFPAGGTAIAHYDDFFAESDTLFLNSFE